MKKIILLLSLSLLLSGCSSDDAGGSLPEELNFKGEVISCGDFSVIQLLDAENSKIALDISGTGRENMELGTEFKVFSLPDNNLSISITVWDAPVGGNFCNDVIMDGPDLISTWNAISGNVRLLVTDIEETEFETFYSITIILENVAFTNWISKEQRTIPSLSIENAGVGWLPG